MPNALVEALPVGAAIMESELFDGVSDEVAERIARNAAADLSLTQTLHRRERPEPVGSGLS